MPMTKREIATVVRRVYESEFKCPVYEAMRRFAGDRVIILCDCHGPKKLNKCPFRDALELAAEEERRARKAKKGATDERGRNKEARGKECKWII